MSVAVCPVPTFLTGSLSNDHGDGNKNGKKPTGLGPVYMEVGDPR